MNSLIDDVHVDISWKIDIDGCFICSHLFSFHYVNVFTSIRGETLSCVAIGWWAALLLIIYLSLPPAQRLHEIFIPQRLDSHSSTQPPPKGRVAAPHMWMCLSSCLLFCLSVCLCVCVCVYDSFVSCIQQEHKEKQAKENENYRDTPLILEKWCKISHSVFSRLDISILKLIRLSLEWCFTQIF